MRSAPDASRSSTNGDTPKGGCPVELVEELVRDDVEEELVQEQLEEEVDHEEREEDLEDHEHDVHEEEVDHEKLEEELVHGELVQQVLEEEVQEDLDLELGLRRPLHARWPAGTGAKLVSMTTQMMWRSTSQGQLGS